MISSKEKYIITLLFFFCISFSTYILTDISNQKNTHQAITERINRIEDRIDLIGSSRWTFDDHKKYAKEKEEKENDINELLQDNQKRLDLIELQLKKF